MNQTALLYPGGAQGSRGHTGASYALRTKSILHNTERILAAIGDRRPKVNLPTDVGMDSQTDRR
jgi:hypothetical protein